MRVHLTQALATVGPALYCQTPVYAPAVIVVGLSACCWTAARYGIACPLCYSFDNQTAGQHTLQNRCIITVKPLLNNLQARTQKSVAAGTVQLCRPTGTLGGKVGLVIVYAVDLCADQAKAAHCTKTTEQLHLPYSGGTLGMV